MGGNPCENGFEDGGKNIKLQKKYEKLVIGKWEAPDNGSDGIWSSTTYLPDNRMIFKWKKNDNLQREDISEYELIGKVLCSTVIETKNTSTPIGFLVCNEIVDLTENTMTLKKGATSIKTSPETTYKLFKVK